VIALSLISVGIQAWEEELVLSRALFLIGLLIVPAAFGRRRSPETEVFELVEISDAARIQPKIAEVPEALVMESSPCLAVMTAERTVLKVLAEEAKTRIAEEIADRADMACDEVQYLIASALRHLPPELRAMPARQALQSLFSEQIRLNQVAQEASSSRDTPEPPRQPLDPVTSRPFGGNVSSLISLFQDPSRQGASQGCTVR